MAGEYIAQLRTSEDSELKTFMLDRLAQAEDKVEPFAAVTNAASYPQAAYWQGQKDALRAALAILLQEPVLAHMSDNGRITSEFVGYDFEN